MKGKQNKRQPRPQRGAKSSPPATENRSAAQSGGHGGRLSSIPKLVVVLALVALAVVVIVAAVDLGDGRPLYIPLGQLRAPPTIAPRPTKKNTAAGGTDSVLFDLLDAEKEIARAVEELERKRALAKKFPLFAAAYPDFDVRLLHARIYNGAKKGAQVIGYLRRGTIIRAKPAVGKSGCPGGAWHPIRGGGYICTGLGYTVGKQKPPVHHQQLAPDRSKPIPYKYVKPRTKPDTGNGAPILRRLPTPKEVAQIEKARVGKAGWPRGIVFKRMNGYFRLSIHKEVRVAQRLYYRTVQGHYVRAADVIECNDPAMQGVMLNDTIRLPVAFVYGKPRPRYRLQDGVLVENGTLDKHARFHAERILKHKGKQYVQAPDNTLVARDHVRIARVVKRPKKIDPKKKWIHVALGQQTLVAYDGDTPVMATLVSSGKKGYRPPRGTFYVHKKYVTVTMGGKDPIEGAYRVEDVPWTMYYWRSYAVHGAYWHNDFGIARSHGCTNISPRDARWMFYWSKPKLPPKWHARIRARGLSVHYTK
jgi:lipoprotein-anchoring transpeptidase ErfK/SrfK